MIVNISIFDPAEVILEVWRAAAPSTVGVGIEVEPTLEQIREDFSLNGLDILGVHKRPLLSGCADYHGRSLQIAFDSESNAIRGPGASLAALVVERMHGASS